ncbi:MAG: cytochrome b/b6 domain-containing protein [Hyphomicrobium sp.]
MEDVIKSIVEKKNKKNSQQEFIRVWDLPTRLFHWSLVFLVALAWISSEYFEELGDPRLELHRWNGFIVLTVLIWRGLWGIWGPPSARFNNFLKGPKAVSLYIRDLLIGSPRHFLGHNPLGALMIVALLTTVTTISLLGLFAAEENGLAAGPLAHLAAEKGQKLATKWHGLIFNPVLIGLISIHIVANILYTFVKKDSLIMAMLSGKKIKEKYEDQHIVSSQKDYGIRAIFFFGLALTNVVIIFFLMGK